MEINTGHSIGNSEENIKLLEGQVRKLSEELKDKEEELRIIKAQLIQSAKMTAIGEMGAGVIHELNNPLTGILGYAQFLLEKLNKNGHDSTESKNIIRYIGYIEKEAARCKLTIENLLVFARKTNHFSLVDLKDILKGTIAIVMHQLNLSNVHLNMDVPDTEVRVCGNESQLQQIFTNIILNAKQAMGSGGELTVSIKPKTDKVDIIFQDTGPGIRAEHINKIFEPFFTTKEDSNGTGLGLTVSSIIVKEHKGIISVKSEAGKGAVFTVELPMACE